MSTSTPADRNAVLSQFGTYAAVVVVAAAVLFFGIGAVSGDDVTPSADGTTTAAPTANPTEEPTSSQTQGEDGQVVNPDDSDAGDDSQDATETPEDAETDDADPAETEEPSADRVPAQDISVQILDGVLDGSNTAAEVRDALVDEGHELIAFGTSTRQYDDTTVFYTEGFEAEANQVAADNGWTVVLPGSEVGLSDAANVHIVVGLSELQ